MSPHVRVRPTLAAVAGTLAVMSITAGIIGWWGLRVASDTDRFEARVVELLRREDVSDALARRVVAETLGAIDLRDRVDETFPRLPDDAVELVLAGARARIEDQLGELIRSDPGVELVGRVAAGAHRQVLAVLRGDPLVDGVEVRDGSVRLNLLPLVGRALVGLQRLGLLSDVVVPELDRSGDPDAQRAALEDALDRELPPEFGQPVVFRSATLEEAGGTIDLARRLLVVAQRSVWVLLGGGVVLSSTSIRLAARRRRAAVMIVSGVAALAIGTWAVTARIRSRAPELVRDPAARDAVSDVIGSLTRSLNGTMLVVVVVTAVVVSAAAVTNRTAARGADDPS